MADISDRVQQQISSHTDTRAHLRTGGQSGGTTSPPGIERPPGPVRSPIAILRGFSQKAEAEQYDEIVNESANLLHRKHLSPVARATAYYWHGTASLQLKDFRQAVESLKQAYENHYDGDPDLAQTIAKIYDHELNDQKLAAYYYQEFKRTHPDAIARPKHRPRSAPTTTPNGTRTATSIVNQFGALAEVGNYDQIEKDCLALLKRPHINRDVKATAHYWLGLVHLERQDLAESIKALQKAHQLGISDPGLPNLIQTLQHKLAPDAPPGQQIQLEKLQLVDLKGRRVNLADYRGKKPILLHFWATWCFGCVEEMPQLFDFYEQFHDKLTIFVIRVDEEQEHITDFMTSKRLRAKLPQRRNPKPPFTLYHDPERKVYEQLPPDQAVVPKNILLDRNGRVVETFVSTQETWHDQRILARIKRQIAKP